MDSKTEREKLVKKYFLKTPLKPKYFWNIFWIFISIILILFGLQFSNREENLKTIAIGIGLALFLFALIGFFTKRNRYLTAYNIAEPKATDEQMDKWLEEGKEMVIKEAMQRLDIESDDTSSDPLIIDGPTNEARIAPGKDNILRFKTHNILVFFLTEHNVSTFQCYLDLAFGEILEDRTKEFPYKDITNLETVTSNDTFYYKGKEKTKIDGLKSFSLFTSGGNKISINYSFIKDTKGSSDYSFPPSDDENTIKSIRKRLKEYKDRSSGGIQTPG
jgi:hypothetical protein